MLYFTTSFSFNCAVFCLLLFCKFLRSCNFISTCLYETYLYRALTYGSRGEVYEVDGKRVAVVFNICGMKTMDAEYEERNTELMQKAIVTWLDGTYILANCSCFDLFSSHIPYYLNFFSP